MIDSFKRLTFGDVARALLLLMGATGALQVLFGSIDWLEWGGGLLIGSVVGSLLASGIARVDSNL